MQVLYSLCNNSFSICLYKIAILDYIGKKQLARAYHAQNRPIGLNHCFAAVKSSRSALNKRYRKYRS